MTEVAQASPLIGIRLINAMLLLKMVRDPEESPADYRLTAILLSVGSMLYLLPLTFGVEVGSQSHLQTLSKCLVSSSNFDLALGIFYVSMALLVGTGIFIFGYVINGQ